MWLMKPDDVPASARSDTIERAHLRDPLDRSHVMHRYEPDDGLRGLVRRFWVPVWSVPAGLEAPQKVLQHPVCLLVVTADYARFYGVTTGLSTTTLSGDGWAVGVMCEPAAGFLVAGEPVAAFTDRYVDLTELLGDVGRRVTARVRAAMADDPGGADSHRVAVAAYGDALRPLLPVDPEGELVNRLVAYVEGNPDVVRVAQVCEAVGVPERALQRLAHRRLGVTPKWLIQRRRLHEAAERLRDNPSGLADVAAALGYADQPHFTRDFSRVTGMTPGEFAAVHRRE